MWSTLLSCSCRFPFDANYNHHSCLKMVPIISLQHPTIAARDIPKPQPFVLNRHFNISCSTKCLYPSCNITQLVTTQKQSMRWYSQPCFLYMTTLSWAEEAARTCLSSSFSSGVAAAAALCGMEENRACVRRQQAVISHTGHFEVQRVNSSILMTLRYLWVLLLRLTASGYGLFLLPRAISTHLCMHVTCMLWRYASGRLLVKDDPHGFLARQPS